MGPYVLHLCDAKRKIAFLTSDSTVDAGERERLTTMKRHLRLLGWQILEIKTDVWNNSVGFEAKADYVEAVLSAGDIAASDDPNK